MQPLFKQLLHPALTTQEAMAILRVSTLPKFGYLMRCVCPHLLLDAVREFDRRVLDTAIEKIGLPGELADEQITQIRLSLRHGGLGLPSAVNTSPIAYSA